MTAPLRVIVVIPALNEEAALGAVLAELARVTLAPWARIERVIVGDNGSTDRTAEVARAAGATVVGESRRGYGAACLAALAQAAPQRSDAIAFLDADGSDDPADLTAVLAPIAADAADLVVGSRVLGEAERGSLTPVQRFGNALASSLMRISFGVRVTDLGPLRAIRTGTLERLAMRDRDYGWTVEMQARALREGARYLEVPVRYRRRRGGRSKVAGTLRGSVGAGWKILWTLARVRLGG